MPKDPWTYKRRKKTKKKKNSDTFSQDSPEITRTERNTDQNEPLTSFDVQMDEIKVQPGASVSGFLRSTSLLPARSLKIWPINDRALQSITNSPSVEKSKEISPIVIKQEQTEGFGTPIISTDINDSFDITTDLQVKKPFAVNQDFITVIHSPTYLTFETEPVGTSNELESAFFPETPSDIVKYTNQPTIAENYMVPAEQKLNHVNDTPMELNSNIDTGIQCSVRKPSTCQDSRTVSGSFNGLQIKTEPTGTSSKSNNDLSPLSHSDTFKSSLATTAEFEDVLSNTEKSIDIKQELIQNYDNSLNASTTLLVNNPSTLDQASETISGDSNDMKIKPEPIGTSPENPIDACNPGSLPIASKNSITGDYAEKCSNRKDIAHNSSLTVEYKLPADDFQGLNPENTHVTEFASVKMEQLGHLSNVCNSENDSQSQIMQIPPHEITGQVKNSDHELPGIVTKASQIQDETNSEIQIVEIPEKTYEIIDLTDDHSNCSTRCSSPVSEMNNDSVISNQITSAAEILRTLNTGLSSEYSNFYPCTVTESKTISRQVFPTPLLKYINLNRSINASIISKLKNLLGSLAIKNAPVYLPTKYFEASFQNGSSKAYKSSEFYPELRDEATQITKDIEVFSNSIKDDGFHLRLHPATLGEPRSKISRKSPEIQSKHITAGVNPLRLDAHALLDQNPSAEVGTEMAANSQAMNSSVSIKMEVQDHSQAGNSIDTNVKTSICTNTIQSVGNFNIAETCLISSKDRYVSSSQVVSHREGTKRCYSSNFVTSSGGQRDSHEIPLKRAKFNYF